MEKVLVPFYRGAVVFENLVMAMSYDELFSSPFIEERLYLIYDREPFIGVVVLVPFYRGAVVFTHGIKYMHIFK